MQDNAELSQLFSLLGIGGGLGQAAGGAYNLFGGGGKNPADVANKYISQIPGQTKEYYSPYMEAGKGAMSNLQNQYKDLLSGNVQNALGANYQQSPGYKFKLNQALTAGQNASNAGGRAGTPMAQQDQMEVANGLASQDYGDYIKNQLSLYGIGLGGNEKLNQQGFQANQDYANTLANTLGQQASYGYAGQAGKNQSKALGMSNLFSGLGMLGGDAGELLKLLGLGG